MRNISLIFRRVAKTLTLFAVLGLAFQSVQAQDIKEGESIFKQNCTACHAIERDLIGPALKGSTERFEMDWLIKWVRNSQSLVQAGDPLAVELFEAHNKMMMPPFPTLSDENITNIFAFVDAQVAEAATPSAGAEGAGGAAGASASGDISNFMLLGLIAVLVIALIVILVLNRVIRTLEKVVEKNQHLILARGEEEKEVRGQKALETIKRLSKNKKLVFFVVLMFVAFLSTAGWKTLWNVGVHEGYQPVQPIKFSHQVHAGINQIDCQYCHYGASSSKNASIPSLNICMNCHNTVQAVDKYGGEISPEIAKIYKALDYDPQTREYGDNKKPVEWIRIHNLPDFAYFNHSQHVVVAGIECQKCHGPIETMEEVYQYSPLTMKWCIECHKETEMDYKDNAYYDQLIAAHDQLKQGEKLTPALLGGLECGKCHY
ncbi:MAG TPA: cytochrome c3 family protein [Sphingobacteriaceae bacterium]|nr:cytochrome c3 family protein [Sphingobacteriaceae bacterium]